MYDEEKLIEEVKAKVEELGEWFLDWGICTDEYKNCQTRAFASNLAARMKSEGYDFYIGRMGYNIN